MLYLPKVTLGAVGGAMTGTSFPPHEVKAKPARAARTAIIFAIFMVNFTFLFGLGEHAQNLQRLRGGLLERRVDARRSSINWVYRGAAVTTT